MFSSFSSANTHNSIYHQRNYGDDNMHLSDPDLDPLISNGSATSTPSKGIVLNKREYRSHSERWGRFRLGVFSVCIFFVIYFCFIVGTWSDQHPQIIVNIPPSDESLPGPRGNDH